jgi:mannose-6-phosphate isomerase-like protein (cupin superfamily)
LYETAKCGILDEVSLFNGAFSLEYLMEMDAYVRHWDGEELPGEGELRRLMQVEGLHPYSWSNGPGDVYVAHSHSYHKVIYVVRGSITFGLPVTGEHLSLNPGDRLELPAGVRHDAVVGPQGVVCLEAQQVNRTSD